MEKQEEIVNLVDLIDMGKSECLNEDPAYPLSNAVRQDSSALLLKSDCDQQLLVKLAFKQPVKIHHIAVRGPAGETRPTSMKIFMDRPALGFEEAEEEKAVQ